LGEGRNTLRLRNCGQTEARQIQGSRKLVLAAALVCAFCALAPSAGAAKTRTTSAWPPHGYYRYSSTIAWKWGSSSNCSQDFMGYGCWHVFVISRKSCVDGLFVTITEKVGGRVVGDVIGTLNGLGARQVADVELDSDRSGSLQGQLAQIKCYSF
jgi:hypothetical protein